MFKYIVEGWLMPSVSLFGLAGNFLSMYILHHREVKLKKEFVDVLCMLATFDNLLLIATFFLFSLPTLSSTYLNAVFPYTVPYLYPLTNTFMTASGYMTAAVAVNRYLDISGGVVAAASASTRLSGYIQASLVLGVSTCINIPRWLEFQSSYYYVSRNETDNVTGEVTIVNESRIVASATELRQSNAYIRDYTLISSTVMIVIVPTIIMLVSSYLIYLKMKQSANSLSFNTSQERARRRRNRNITFVLVGIVLLFLVCHIGEVIISIYELADVLDGERTPFAPWATNLVIVNHFFIVINSSLNFVIYCKDIVFRRVFMMSYYAMRCGKSSARSTANQLNNIKKELGDAEEVAPDPCPEVVVHDNLDAQSQILCGISKV